MDHSNYQNQQVTVAPGDGDIFNFHSVADSPVSRLNHTVADWTRNASHVNITHMDPDMYKAAMDGKADILQQKADQFGVQKTPSGNKVLHVASLYGRLECVKVILDSNSLLLWELNAKDETALHLAARMGHSDIVEFLIKKARGDVLRDVETGIICSRALIRMVNLKKNTALHEAAQFNHHSVVKLLIKEDPEFAYAANAAGETPLYIAVERRFIAVAYEILETCSSPSHDGPFGRTPLHAVVRCDDKCLMKKLLEKWPELVKERDQGGWTPLHVAAYLDSSSGVKQLLHHDKSAAYCRNNDGRTALHVAASVDAKFSIKQLISFCPDCVEVVDNGGRNVLHVAAEMGHADTIKYILRHSLFKSLINEGDNEGNTPLHLLAKHKKYVPALINHCEVDKWALNNNDLTALEIIPNASLSSTCAEVDIRDLLKRRMHIWDEVFVPDAKKRKSFKYDGKENAIGEEETKQSNRSSKPNGKENVDTEGSSILARTRETHLIVATLIATVTFAAGFTLPGGYNQQDPGAGLAVLAKKMAFQAFLVSDTIAMILALAAVFIHFISAMHDEEETHGLLQWATILAMVAMGAMVVSFVTGIYVVLGHSSAVAISLVVIGGCFFFFYFYHFRRYL